MHVILVRLRLKPQYVAEFEQEMRAHVAATRRTEPGCLQFDVAADKVEPNTYHLFEVYADERAMAEHVASPTLKRLGEKLRLWVEERERHDATLWPRTH
jgi:quinol monooxygenase YgiN